MKRKIILLVALAVMFTAVLSLGGYDTKSVMASPTFQRVNFVNGVVSASKLNVRQGPSTEMPIVCVLTKGQVVKVFGKIGDWYAVYDPETKCVGSAASQYIKPSTNGATGQTNAETPQLAANNPPAVQKPTTTPDGITAEEQTLLDLVNSERRKAGAGVLAFDMNVVKVAREKARDMVDNKYFAHQSPTYGSPFDMLRKFGVTYKTAGENIAGNPTVEGAFKAWMNSPGHKKNILNGNFNYCGFGIVKSPTYGKVLVQQFIGR